ncbi:MAG: Hpt domain-containing protein [Pirellulales bacterium]
MSQANLENPIFSTYGNDSDMGELVEMFVDEMPDRIEALLEVAQNNDWEKLRSLAHQLKGAGGSYGFGQLTQPAASLESACRENDTEDNIRQSLTDLVSICRRAQTGSPS